jgi:hypothetical protein
MHRALTVWIFALTLTLPISAYAHHSFAAFDRSHEQEVTGTVKEWQWTNPHTWLFITVIEAGGNSVDYSFEGYNPLELPRLGITRNKFKPGDKVTVKYFPRKDNTNGGQFVGVTFAANTPTSGAAQ